MRLERASHGGSGPRLTVDYTATRVIRLLGRQIVIDVISAGIVRETGAAVTFDTSVAGVDGSWRHCSGAARIR